jgi:hypothetical protein
VDIGNSTTVVGFSYHVSQSFKWNVLIMVQELDELLFGDLQVRHRELVTNVPSEGTKLSSLKNDCVEEAETPDELPEYDGLRVLKVVIFNHAVGFRDVRFKALRWFTRSLKTVLNDCHWELIRGHCGEPDSEGGVVIRHNVINQGVKRWHERWSQMAVLQDDPRAFSAKLRLVLLRSLDCLDSFATLAFTEGKGFNLDLL